MSFSEQMSQLLTGNNLRFLFDGLKLTLYISFVSIILSTIFGTILAVLRNQKNRPLKFLASLYIEIVRNIPNLLWIYVIFLIFKIKSTPAGIVSFTVFTTAALAEIIRGGLNGVDKGQKEAARSQGFSKFQILLYIVLPQAIRNVLPAIVSQFVTVIKDTSFLYSVIALQELFGKSYILMGRYAKTEQVFAIYGLVALMYFVINFSISQFSRWLSRNWA
ncbi:amino acid ABC transporter permease [Enterococcus caccae]|uniref:His/Glu/Gln/Arg/opine family amino ABC transporter, permease, 3-TM region n=1 Tax=Enterococcus caccae ATCC BAA-1240 TaxID=1158612 RepID=R3WRL9_9ENTE|nr:amino acid ABC transporter permease [Enterococcus caccae]EOL44465.1 His/Glu/Gln/Arg/opine family amino ABC transporter, permease, 3-TM region [Enterococcus caccae ATCC BAA-1240]EOT68419.1 amino acid ABC transporter permease [Enterococcus caccae ATCC BAA-1240]OJG28372.1 His/Glu/Gln/Arg/opine family amino ABC transporter, permease, 3-TM region [Enterococcus caccae]